MFLEIENLLNSDTQLTETTEEIIEIATANKADVQTTLFI